MGFARNASKHGPVPLRLASLAFNKLIYRNWRGIEPQVRSGSFTTEAARLSAEAEIDFAIATRDFGRFLLWVKMRNTRIEPMFSGLPLIADMGADLVDVRVVPLGDIAPLPRRLAVRIF